MVRNLVERDKCPHCGGDKAVAGVAIAGVAGYYVLGSRRLYCPMCDTPPTLELHACDMGVVMVPDEEAEMSVDRTRRARKLRERARDKELGLIRVEVKVRGREMADKVRLFAKGLLAGSK